MHANIKYTQRRENYGEMNLVPRNDASKNVHNFSSYFVTRDVIPQIIGSMRNTGKMF